MSIGMYDMDMATYTLVPFNLELMKLSAYYKKKREIVILSPEMTPDRHQKFFLRKDFNDGKFPAGLEKIPNLDYGGYAFTNGMYVPMTTEIETMRPDASLYSNMEKTIMASMGRDRKKIFQNMMEAEHCRLSLDGKAIWEDYPKQFKFLKTARNLMFHDYDLGAIEGSFEEVKALLGRARTDGWATRVGMKFPVGAKSGQELLNWMSILPNSTFYSLKYDGVIDDDCFEDFVGIAREKSIYKQFDYYITTSCANQQEFITKYIQRIYRQVVKSRSHRVFFSLKYEQDFFFDKRWERVLDLFNFYHNSMSSLPQSVYFNKIANDTLYDFARVTYKELPKYCKGYMDRQEIRDLFHFVREEYPALFDDFYTYNIKKMEG